MATAIRKSVHELFMENIDLLVSIRVSAMDAGASFFLGKRSRFVGGYAATTATYGTIAIGMKKGSPSPSVSAYRIAPLDNWMPP